MFSMGIDIGSTTSKCVILRDGKEIVGESLIKAGIGTGSARSAFEAAISNGGIAAGNISCLIATGYGRYRWDGADGIVSELTAHAIGSHFLFPEARTVIDIGGQDAKVISINEHGQMLDFIMNDKCAAGTGRFLDVMAGTLNLKQEQLQEIAAQSKSAALISSTCTVFAESEVISQLAAGAHVPDIVAGICHSVASRVAALAKRIGFQTEVCMSGGVALNGGVRRAMEQILAVRILHSPFAQLTGAIGAALYACQKNKNVGC